MKLVDLEKIVKKVFYDIISTFNMELKHNEDSLELSNSNCRIIIKAHKGELYFNLYMIKYDNLVVSPFLWGLIINELDKNGIILGISAPNEYTSESIVYSLCYTKAHCALFCKKLFDGTVSDSEIEKYISKENEVNIEINKILMEQLPKDFQ